MALGSTRGSLRTCEVPGGAPRRNADVWHRRCLANADVWLSVGEGQTGTIATWPVGSGEQMQARGAVVSSSCNLVKSSERRASVRA